MTLAAAFAGMVMIPKESDLLLCQFKLAKLNSREQPDVFATSTAEFRNTPEQHGLQKVSGTDSHKVSDSFVLWSDPWILQYTVRKHVNICGVHTWFRPRSAARYTGFCFVLNIHFKDKVFVLVLIFISKLNHLQAF